MKKNIYIFIVTFLIFNKILKAENVVDLKAFNYEEALVSDLGEPLLLWATHYNLPELKDGTGDFPLRDVKGNELGPKFSLNEWCKIALEGSARITFLSGEVKTYNYDGISDLFSIDCSTFFLFNVSNSKFHLAKGDFGDGVGRYKLTPFRTIATDPLIIPFGSVIYIPQARGTIIKTKYDEQIIHDGYFFAGDTGGVIKLNHIDVFIGTQKKSPFFSWIKHNNLSSFQAYIVKDQSIIKSLCDMHLRSR